MRFNIFLLIIFIYVVNVERALGDSATNDASPFQIVLVGVPESKTDNPEKGDTLLVKSTRRLEATYSWDKSPLKDKCNYKIKAEAVTVVQTVKKVVAATEIKSRYFLKIYVDHKLLDIVEHDKEVRFDDNVIKYGWFIINQIVDSCERVTFEYLTRGKSCRARLYEKQNYFTRKVEDKKVMFIQDWQWRAYDEDECENRSSRDFAAEYAQQHQKIPSATKV